LGFGGVSVEFRLICEPSGNWVSGLEVRQREERERERQREREKERKRERERERTRETKGERQRARQRCVHVRDMLTCAFMCRC